MYLFSQKFWTYAFERVVKTMAQAAVAVITGEAFGIFNGDAWLNVVSIAALAGLTSLLMALTAYSAVNNDSDMKALESTVDRITRKTEIIDAADVKIKETASGIVSGTATVSLDEAKG
jgi:1,4-dihydroxy-2-naphthoate octaprenyltransferase